MLLLLRIYLFTQTSLSQRKPANLEIATDTFFILRVKGKMFVKLLFMHVKLYNNKMPGKTSYSTVMSVQLKKKSLPVLLTQFG